MSGLTVSRMDFGAYMRKLRGRKSILAASVYLGVSRQVLMRLEDGLPTKLTRRQIEDLITGCFQETGEELVEAMRLYDEIAAQDAAAKAAGNTAGLWKAYSDQVAPNFQKFLRLEAAAESITTYQPVIVPGLLQTPDYRRAIIRIDNPDLSAVDLERRLELTTKRQARLDEPGFRMEAILSEAVLRNRPGDPASMAAQLRWLIEISRTDNVSLRVIPFSVPAHRGLTIQVFTLLRLPTGESGMVLPPVAYAEGAIGSVFHESAEEVSVYQRAIQALNEVALTEDDTGDLVSRIAKEYAA